MITFLISIAALILGYFLYGKFIEKLFGILPSRETPAKYLEDNIDYKELQPWRIFVIQFLNIAGLGPIFGAILGAAYGPAAYLWIVLGCIFMGAVHDFFSGMLSIRMSGRNMPTIMGKYLGKGFKKVGNVVFAFVLICAGCSFVIGPADLMADLTQLNKWIWLFVIFGYYVMATLLPIDKIIGKLYPFMGAILLFMAISIGGIIIWKGFSGSIQLTELTPATLRNFHSDPAHNILVPMLFIVISCGAISGFHSSQSPLMARCMGNEKLGRPIFYGAMICEGVVALIWATAAIAYCGGVEGLNAAAAAGKTPAILVNEICRSWLGTFGAIIAIIGVVFCPITSGDTAFRSLRLIIAEALKIDQKSIKKRILTVLPIFAFALVVCFVDFSTIWRYLGLGNQIIAMLVLWTGAKFLAKHGKAHWALSIPATFITFICICYLMVAPYKAGGLALPVNISYIIAAIIAATAFNTFNTYALIKRDSPITKRLVSIRERRRKSKI